MITIIEIWRRSVDRGGQASALLIDLSKAFDCTDHELLIAKRYAYGYDKNSLYFINLCLKGRQQRTEINSFPEILFAIAQGSPKLGPLLFNIYICDLFLENIDIDIANYADDNTPYACSSDSDSVIFKLQKNTKIIFSWFCSNIIIINFHCLTYLTENPYILIFTCFARPRIHSQKIPHHLNFLSIFLYYSW